MFVDCKFHWSFKSTRVQTWHCALCSRNEVKNKVESDPTNLEGISALKKYAKRRTAAVNDVAYAILAAMS